MLTARARLRAGDQEQPDPRHGRDARGGPHRADATCIDAGCDIVTITQYLRPSARHHPVERWVSPRSSSSTQQFAEGLGFAGVLAGPLVRSSYRAGRLYAQASVATSGAAGGDIDPYPEPMAKIPQTRGRSQGRKGRGEGCPQGGVQAAPQSAVAGVPDPAQRGQAATAVHDRRVRADRGGGGGCGRLRRRVHDVHADPARRGAGCAGGVHHLRPPRAEVGVPQGRGPDRRGGVGAGQPARQVARDPRRRGDRPFRRGAPRDRPARA